MNRPIRCRSKFRTIRRWPIVAAFAVLAAAVVWLAVWPDRELESGPEAPEGGSAPGPIRPAGPAQPDAPGATPISARPFVDKPEGAPVAVADTSGTVVLRGRVVDPGGAPIAKAYVRVGSKDELATDEFPAPTDADLVVLSGPDGSFRLAGVPSGLVPAYVRAEGFTPWHDVLEVREESGPVEVRLGIGGVVEGVVRDVRGVPVGSAAVALSLFHSATSADDGSYRITGLPPSEVRLWTSSGPGPDRCLLSPVLAVDPRRPVRWDPVLPEGREVTVRLEDREGRPLGGLLVVAWGQVDYLPSTHGLWSIEKYGMSGPMTALWTETGADGRARLRGCGGIPYAITVRHPRRRDWIILEGPVIGPSSNETLLTLDRAALPSAHIIGRVRAAGFSDYGLSVLSLDRNEDEAVGWRDDGSFHAGPLPPGRYRIGHDERGIPPLEKDLTASETWDAGDITLAERGGIRIEVSGVLSDLMFGGTCGWIAFRDDGRIQRRSYGTERDPWPELPPGRYRIQVTIPGYAVVSAPVEVVAGGFSTLEVRAERGGECLFDVERAVGEGRLVRLEVADASGRPVHVHEVRARQGRCRSYARLLQGAYTVRAAVPEGGGWRAAPAVAFTAPPPDAPARIVRVALPH